MKHTILIFYNSATWAKILYEQLIQEIPKKLIQHTIYSKFNIVITLIGGSKIQFVHTHSNTRGLRFTQAYIQRGIDAKYYTQVIQPMSSSIRPIYIIDTLEDIVTPHTEAKSYYYVEEG